MAGDAPSSSSILNAYIQNPLNQYIETEREQFWFFHSNAPLWLILSIYLLYGIAVTFIVAGFYDISVEDYNYFWTDYFSSYENTPNFFYVFDSYTMFMTAGCAASVLFLALEGTIFPIKWILTQYPWYILGSLTYTGYLLSIMTSYTVAAYGLYWNNNEQLTWDETNGLSRYAQYYWMIVAINLCLAIVLTFLVERPFMNLSKAIEL